MRQQILVALVSLLPLGCKAPASSEDRPQATTSSAPVPLKSPPPPTSAVSPEAFLGWVAENRAAPDKAIEDEVECFSGSDNIDAGFCAGSMFPTPYMSRDVYWKKGNPDAFRFGSEPIDGQVLDCASFDAEQIRRWKALKSTMYRCSFSNGLLKGLELYIKVLPEGRAWLRVSSPAFVELHSLWRQTLTTDGETF